MKPQLAVVTRNFAKTSGGAESLAVSLAMCMLGEYDITVVSQLFVPPPIPEGAHLKHVLVPKLPIGSRWINQLWFSWYTRRVTRSGFDVVHSYENITHGSVQTVSVKTVHASLKQRGMSALRIALSPRLLAYLWLENRRMLNARHHCVFVSQFVHDETRQYMAGLPECTVVPPGVDIPSQPISDLEKAAARERLGLRAGVMTVGFVGHDFKKKGLDVLLAGAALLPFDVQIMVIGKPGQAVQYADRVKALGEGKTCRFMGVVADMQTAYATMDCLAHPTTQDVFPMVLLEAMARQIPVLTTTEPHNNMGSLLTDQTNALLLQDPDDSAAVARALRQLRTDKALTAKLARNGFEFAQRYSWDVAKIKYYAVYDKARAFKT